MAEDSLKDLTVNWIIGGFLIFCLLTFAVGFMYYNNNSYGFDEGSRDIFDSTGDNYSNKILVESKDSSNKLLNITANTNPEVSDLGSRDSVAAGYEAQGNVKSNWDSSKKLLSFIFSGDSGKAIIATIGTLLSFLGGFYLWRFIKNGL